MKATRSATQPELEPTKHTKVVMIRCDKVHIYGNGLAGIEVPAYELPHQTRVLLSELFPNTLDQVHDLLDTEALLGAIAKGPTPPPRFEQPEVIDTFSTDR